VSLYNSAFFFLPRIIEEYGELSLDLDISTLEINPCGFSSEQEKDNDMITNPLYYFRDSHKCDRVKGTSVVSTSKSDIYFCNTQQDFDSNQKRGSSTCDERKSVGVFIPGV